MKKLFTVLLFLFSTQLFAQTALAYLQDGISKQKNEEYEAAITSYSRAIVIEATSKEALYNRGVCKLILKKDEAAIEDFTKVLRLDPKFIKAYYSRATAYVNTEQFKKALPDLSQTILLNDRTPNALTLRGQIRAQTGNLTGACEDLHLAREYGDRNAEKYIKQFCKAVINDSKMERLRFQWTEGWKVGDDQENSSQHVVDYIPKGETIGDWTEIINKTCVKNVVGVPMNKAMNMMYERMKTTAPEAKLSFIEKDEQADYPWILFTIESPRYENDETPESQLWYIVQGKQHLFLNFRAIKKDHLPTSLLSQWKAFFMTAEFVAQ